MDGGTRLVFSFVTEDKPGGKSKLIDCLAMLFGNVLHVDLYPRDC